MITNNLKFFSTYCTCSRTLIINLHFGFFEKSLKLISNFQLNCPLGAYRCSITIFGNAYCCSCIDWSKYVPVDYWYTLTQCNNLCRARITLNFQERFYCCTCLDEVTPTTTAAPPLPSSPPCFPSHAKMSLKNGNTVMMSELQIGDQVQTGTNTERFHHY